MKNPENIKYEIEYKQWQILQLKNKIGKKILYN